MACLTAGRVGCGGGPDILFPSRGGKPARLQNSIGNHRHQGVTVRPDPRAGFEVIQAKFLFQLLVRLLADPARFDGAD